MAEGWARALAETLCPGTPVKVCSAGLEAHGLNPLAVQTMQVHGIDISNQSSDVINEQMISEASIIITVCSHADEHCPIVPSDKQKIHIPFMDPAKATGTQEEISSCFDTVCLEIKSEVKKLLLGILDEH